MTFEEAWAVVSKIDGPLSIGEATELWRTTQNLTGEVVDVGTGARSCLLLGAAGPVTCTIPFDEFNEQSYSAWRDQIINSGYASNIYVIKKDDKAYHTWEMPIGLLVMHAWDAADQIHGWKMHLAPGAAVCVFHYGAGFPSEFRKEKEVGSLTTFRYTPEAIR